MLGVVLLVGAILAVTATVHAGQYDCGSALSAHTPDGQFLNPVIQSRAEDRCDAKITRRRLLVAVVGGAGLLIAIGGAVDHEKRRGDHGPESL